MSSWGEVTASAVKWVRSAHDGASAGSGDQRQVVSNDILKPQVSHPLPNPATSHSRLEGQTVVSPAMPLNTEIPPDDPIDATDINLNKKLVFKLDESLSYNSEYHQELALELTVSRATVDTTAIAPVGWGSWTLKTNNGNTQVGATIEPDSYWLHSLWTTHYTENARRAAQNPLNVKTVAVTSSSVTYHIPIPWDLTKIPLHKVKGGVRLEYQFRNGGVNTSAGLLALESANIVTSGSLVHTRGIISIREQGDYVFETGFIEMHHQSATKAITPGTATDVTITMDKSAGAVVGVLLYATKGSDAVPNCCWWGTQTSVNWLSRTDQPLIPKPVEMSELLYSSAIPSDARTLADPTAKDTVANTVLWSFGDDASNIARGAMSGVHFLHHAGDTTTKLVISLSATAAESMYGTEATFARGQGADDYTFHAVTLLHRTLKQDGGNSLYVF